MALYAFDGTWNTDTEDDLDDTNVVRFREVYGGADFEYVTGVGTRFGAIGRAVGGLFGTGGRSRIKEMYETLCENWRNGDRDIDIIGFSRGAALAVHFANKIGKDGIDTGSGNSEPARIRFLGIWDLVGSFGLSFDTFVDFNDINLGWDIDEVAQCVDACSHAMALDERRETFNVTRLNPDNRHNHIEEVWFRGVHSDIGGGNKNPARSNIALTWMLDKARACNVPINDARTREAKYSETDRFAPISENKDIARDPRRQVGPGDAVHESAHGVVLEPGQTRACTVRAAIRYNWSGVRVQAGQRYRIAVPDGQHWLDGGIECGPEGWRTEQLPWLKERFVERFEGRRRHPDANWFELIAALGDEDDTLARIGGGAELAAEQDADLYLFANDLKGKYDNNEGTLSVEITRIP